MEAASPDSRKRFSPWLEQTINEGNCPGLEWVDRHQRTFKVPWYHFNRSMDIDTHFKVFRDWAIYTGMHLSGDDLDYPKWKRNFRCALNKVSDIAEVPALHSVKDAPAPYKVYKFLYDHTCSPKSTPTPESEEIWVLVDHQETPDTPSLMSFVQLDASSLDPPDSTDPIEVKTSTNVTFAASHTDVKHTPSSLPALRPNIPTVVMDSLPFFADVCEQRKEQTTEPQLLFHKQPGHSKPQEIQRRARNDHQVTTKQQRQQHRRDFEQVKAMPQFFVGTNVEHFSEASNSDDDAPMTLTQNDVILDLSNKGMSTIGENILPGLIDVKPEQTDKSEGSIDQKSIPSDLGSVNSDDLIRMSTGSPSYPASTSFEREPNTDKDFPLLLPSVCKGKGDIVIKAFYGFHQQKVLDRTIANSERGCRVYFGEPKRDIPDMVERMYGPKDAFQLELPRADVCGNATLKQLDFIEAILREMHRGVIVSTSHGDVYVRRFCRTRAFVYDQDSQSWPLNRKMNIPEKIFDFEIFKARFETYKQEMRSGSQNSFPPVPYVYLTFGHRVPLENDIHGKVLVAMTITHKEAEQMLRKFHDSLGTDKTDASGSRLLSSMDTMDKVIESYEYMSIE